MKLPAQETPCPLKPSLWHKRGTGVSDHDLSTLPQGAAVCCVCVCLYVLTGSSQHRDQHIPLQLEQHKCQSLLFLGLFESLLWQRWLLRLQMGSET